MARTTARTALAAAAAALQFLPSDAARAGSLTVFEPGSGLHGGSDTNLLDNTAPWPVEASILTVIVMTLLVTVAMALCWARRRSVDPATSTEAQVHQSHGLTSEVEDAPAHHCSTKHAKAQGNLMMHLRPTAPHTGTEQRSEVAIEVVGPAQSRRAFERPDVTRQQRSQFQTQEARADTPVTFNLPLVFTAAGFSTIAHSDPVHFNIMALTQEEIRLSDLPLVPINAEHWVRVLLGNTWHYPVALCGPHDSNVTAWKMCELLMRNFQFRLQDRFPTDPQQTTFTGRLPEGPEFIFERCSEGLVTVPLPLQFILPTGSYSSNQASLMAQHNRAAPSVDWRWNISNPMHSPARDRLHDCGGYLEDMEAFFDQHQMDNQSWPGLAEIHLPGNGQPNGYEAEL